jgi:hypothetical protein
MRAKRPAGARRASAGSCESRCAIGAGTGLGGRAIRRHAHHALPEPRGADAKGGASRTTSSRLQRLAARIDSLGNDLIIATGDAASGTDETASELPPRCRPTKDMPPSGPGGIPSLTPQRSARCSTRPPQLVRHEMPSGNPRPTDAAIRRARTTAVMRPRAPRRLRASRCRAGQGIGDGGRSRVLCVANR